MNKLPLDPGLEIDLQQLIAKRFRIRPGSPEYAQLRALPAFDAAARRDEAACDSIFKQAKALALAARRRRATERRIAGRAQRKQAGVTSSELLRSEVVARELARLGRRFGKYRRGGDGPEGTASLGYVQWFRDRYCEGKALSESEARLFLSSPAMEYGATGSIERLGLTPGNHTSRLESCETRPTLEPLGRIERVVLTIHVGGVDYPFVEERHQYRDWPMVPMFAGDELEILTIRPDTAFEFLDAMCVILSQAFPWDPKRIGWFLLTDEMPPMPPVRYEIKRAWHAEHAQLRVNLSISPWVSAESLSRIYRAIQRDVLGYVQNRPTTVESLKLFDFVSEELGQSDPSSWTEIARAWNKTRPKSERYSSSNLKNIQRDFERIRRQIMHMTAMTTQPKKA